MIKGHAIIDTQRVSPLKRNLASTESATYALANNSGMAATVSMMNILKQGDHILCCLVARTDDAASYEQSEIPSIPKNDTIF